MQEVFDGEKAINSNLNKVEEKKKKESKNEIKPGLVNLEWILPIFTIEPLFFFK